MTKLILVTGANGFVGSHVVEELLNAGYPVRCLLRPHSRPSWIETLPVDIQRVDYFDANKLRKAVENCNAIFHFGGATKAPDRDAYFHANAKTTGVLLEAASDACPDLSLFLFCSSQAAVGPSPSLDPLTEDAPLQPISTYGWSKMNAEKICREFEGRFPITIVRPPAIYGPRDKDILIFFRAIRWGISPSIGKGHRYLSIVFVKDVARLCLTILERKPQGTNIYHVTDGEVHRWKEMGDAIAEALHRRPLQVTIPTGLAVLISHLSSRWASATRRIATLNREKLNEIVQNYWLISSRKAEVELGFVPVYHLERGVTETVQWYRQHRWL